MMKFTELELQPEILQALDEMRYEEMTPIQEQVIPHVLEGRDVMGLAETGSGKTGACGVPLIQGTDPDLNAIQALILVPTRELALQYVQELDDIARHTRVVPFAVFGGFDMGIQKAKLRHKVDILVATPGRLIDFLWNTDLDLTQVRAVVLDEADEMLKMGFIEDVDFILSCLIHQHRTLLFSATMPREIDRLARTYLKDPVRVELNKDQIAPQSLAHHFLHTGRNRLQALMDYLKKENIQQALMFCNSRDKATDLHKDLQSRVDSLDFIHGGLDQERRISIFNRFRRKQIKFMVATDVAARGLDFTHVTHVINYDFPFSSQIYTHRTGRTGRMGRVGTAMTFVANRDLGSLKTLLKENRIEPVWCGPEPDLEGASSRAGRGRSRNGKRPPRQRGPRRRNSKKPVSGG
jgi:ATP-dependent RNA helicase DeaD